jgi:hypothetical protein
MGGPLTPCYLSTRFQQARRVAVFLLGIDAHCYVFTARIIYSEPHFEFLPTLFNYYLNTMFVMKYLRIFCLLTIVAFVSGNARA